MTDLGTVNLTATDMVSELRSKNISARELMEAHLEMIDLVNPKVNAIVTLHAELGLKGADLADKAMARGDALGILHGLPTAHKDLVLTEGIRTTYGSPLFANYVPDISSLIVERMQAAGAITIGKTNTPEFGAGSQTYNEVFGETLNPYDSINQQDSYNNFDNRLGFGYIPIGFIAEWDKVTVTIESSRSLFWLIYDCRYQKNRKCTRKLFV